MERDALGKAAFRSRIWKPRATPEKEAIMALVKMYHDNPALTGGPTTADVPEEAVRSWERHGWSTVPFGKKAKGEAVPMYREIADGVATATVPDAAVHTLEAEGWTVRPLAQPKAAKAKAKAKAEAVNA